MQRRWLCSDFFHGFFGAQQNCVEIVEAAVRLQNFLVVSSQYGYDSVNPTNFWFHLTKCAEKWVRV